MPAPSISVLYVDDDPDLRAIVKISLELDERLMVQAVGDAEEALAALGSWSPDLLLLDVSMPNIGGIELLKMLRERGVSTPVIFLTAHALSHEHEPLKAAGARAVLTKPFDPLTLASTIGSIVQQL